MQIEKLKIKKLYGYIDKEIIFNEDFTLLVGINGSGKTSVLNIINFLVTPSVSIPNLCVLDFSSVELTFKIDNFKYKVSCQHKKTIFKYMVEKEGVRFEPLKVKIETPPKEIKDEEERNRLLYLYSLLRPDNKKERETWNVVIDFPKPTVIGLDRNLYTEEADKMYFEEKHFQKSKNKLKSDISPLKRVKDIVNTDYIKRKNEILKLTNDLKNHLVVFAFNGNVNVDSFESGIKKKLDIKKIEKADKQIIEFLKQFNEELSIDEQNAIKKYFVDLKKIIKDYEDNPSDSLTKLIYGLNSSQFLKINKLLVEFKKFEEASEKSFHNINRYLDVLNSFFKDSAKELKFNDELSEISFCPLDEKGKDISGYKDISCLSSGEQQLLILFSYIAFNNQDGKIFIIDEPELSLHIKWQENFISSLEKVTPEDTQIILATHSPILAGKKKEKAVVLSSNNK